MTDEKTRAVLEEMRALEKSHRIQSRDGFRADHAAEADRLKRWGDAFEAALTVPDGDVRERIAEIVYAKVEYRGDINYVSGEDKDSEQYLYCQNAADAILAAFPVLSRDIAVEIEAEIEWNEARAVSDYLRGLRRAAEIVRRGR